LDLRHFQALPAELAQHALGAAVQQLRQEHLYQQDDLAGLDVTPAAPVAPVALPCDESVLLDSAAQVIARSTGAEVQPPRSCATHGPMRQQQFRAVFDPPPICDFALASTVLEPPALP